jgi:uncharacterized protein YrrD
MSNKKLTEGLDEINELAESLKSFREDSKLREVVSEAVETGKESWNPNLGFNTQIFLDGEMLGMVKKIEFIKDFLPDSWTQINIERYFLHDSKSIEELISNNSKIEIRYICDEEVYAEQSATKLRRSKLVRTVDADTTLPIEKIELLTKNAKFEYVS